MKTRSGQNKKDDIEGLPVTKLVKTEIRRYEREWSKSKMKTKRKSTCITTSDNTLS